MIFSFFIVLFLIAYDAFCLFAYKMDLPKLGQNIFFALASAILSAIFCSTLLTIVGLYHIWLLITVLAGIGLIGLALLGYKKMLILLPSCVNQVREYRWNYPVLAIMVTCAFLYFAFPTTYMLGGRDQGLYVINGVNIAKTGAMQLDEDKYLTENYESLKNVIHLGYLGIYSAYARGLSDKPGDLIPQFLPMFPSALAIGYDLFGIPGLVRVNCVIGLMALLFIYYFTKKIFNSETALLALVFMAINPAQLWNARITQTELMCQVLFFISVTFFISAWEKEDRNFSVLSGIMIGIGAFCRVDTYIWGPGVYIVFIYSLFFRKDKYKTVLLSTISATIVFVLVILYGFYFSNPYYTDLWESGSLKGIIQINIVFIFSALLCFLLAKTILKKKEISNYLLLFLDNKSGNKIVTGSLSLLFLFAYFIRPLLSDGGDFNAHAMVEFTWYTSFIAVPLAILGIHYVIQKNFVLREEIFLFLLIGVTSMIGYIYRPSITPDHIWASRRWITINIPFILILAAYAICRQYVLMHFKRTALIFCGVFSFWIFDYMENHTLSFLTETMLKNYDKQYEAFVPGLEKDALYFTDRWEIPGIMKYIYGLNAFWVHEGIDYFIRDLIILSKQQNKNFYFLTDRKLPAFAIDRSKAPLILDGKYLEKSRGAYPRNLFDRKIRLDIYKLDNTIDFNITDGMLVTFTNREGNDIFFINKGFSEPEDGFRWSNANYAELIFNTANIQGKNVIAKFDIIPFLHGDVLREQRVNVFINDISVDNWVISKGTTKELILKPEYLVEDSVRLGFQFPDAASPKSVGYSEDERNLAIAFKSIQFSVTTQEL